VLAEEPAAVGGASDQLDVAGAVEVLAGRLAGGERGRETDAPRDAAVWDRESGLVAIEHVDAKIEGLTDAVCASGGSQDVDRWWLVGEVHGYRVGRGVALWIDDASGDEVCAVVHLHGVSEGDGAIADHAVAVAEPRDGEVLLLRVCNVGLEQQPAVAAHMTAAGGRRGYGDRRWLTAIRAVDGGDVSRAHAAALSDRGAGRHHDGRPNAGVRRVAAAEVEGPVMHQRVEVV